MTAVNELHNQAMENAEKGYVADLHGDFSNAQAHFRRAFELEREAAQLLIPKTDAEPTRSVLLRSAASLAVKCAEHREAERLVAIALAGNPPAEICEELRDLLDTVYFDRHLAIRGLRLDPGEIQMSLSGAAIGHGIIESHQFLRRAEFAEKMLIRTSERLRHLPFREAGVPSQEAMEGFEVFFSAPRAASFAITIRIGRPVTQPVLEGLAIGPKQVVDEVLTCLRHYNAEDPDRLKQRIPDEPYFNNFKALARKLAPDGQRVKAVNFTSFRGNEQKQAFLNKPPSPIWEPPTDAPDTITLKGVIRRADETKARGDQPFFAIEDENGNARKVVVPPGMLQDIVRPLWGERVTVVAKRTKRKQFLLLTIDSVQEAATSP